MKKYSVKKLERKLCSHSYKERVIKRFELEEDAVAFLSKLYEGLVKQFGPSKQISLYRYSGIEMGYDTRYIIVSDGL